MMYGLLPNKILLSMSTLSSFSGCLPCTVVGLAPVSPWSAAWASQMDSGAHGLVLYVVALVKPGAMGGGDMKMAG